MLLDFGRMIGRLSWLIVLYFFLKSQGSRGDTFELMATGMTALTIVGSFFRWLTLRFGIVGPNFVYLSTWLVKVEKTIPIDRIQSVHIEQSVGHRLLGLAKVRVDTATSGANADIELDSLSLSDAERLRDLLTLQAAHPTLSASIPAEEVLWRATPRDLMLAGVTQNNWPIVVGAGLSLMQLIRSDESTLLAMVGRGIQGKASPLVWAGAIVALLLGGWVVSIARAWIRFFGFTLSIKQSRLHREYGLFNQRKNSVPLRRIQSLIWRTTWLRNWVGFWDVHCHTAGEMKDKDDPTVGGLLCPVVQSSQLRRFTNIVYPDLDWSQVRWHHADMRATWVRFVDNLWIYGILTAAIVIWQRGWTFGLIPVAILISAVSAWLSVRSNKFAFTGRYGLAQTGWRNIDLLIIPLDKVQSVSVTQGFLERKLGLAEASFEVAGSPTFVMRNLPAALVGEAAEKLVPWVAHTGSWSPDGV